MKTVKYIQSKIAFPLALLVLTLLGCERDLSDEVVFATFPTTAEIYTDAPVGLTDEFFISFDPAVGANTEGFGTDDNEAFEGTSSIRIDVPSPTDPDGNFIGGIFRDRGEGRDLSGYDALTFWAKGSLTGTILVGFGTDFITDTYPVSTSIQLTAGWRKYVIPIPDAAKLTQERGMFLFSAGSFDALGNDNPQDASSFTDNIGYTFWMDELRFEKLGTTDLTSAFILNGQDVVIDNFAGYTQTIDGIGATYNLANGQNVTVTAAPSYYEFSSSDTSVATVTPTGDVSVSSAGTVTISATLANEAANGSLTVNAAGAFVNAPDPTLPASDVISVYSDAYSNIAGFNPAIFADSNVGPISLQSFSGNEHINYSSINAFLGMGWDGTIDASGATTLHIDIQLVGSTSNLIIEIEDFGANGTDEPPFSGGSDDNSGGFNVTNQLVDGQWVSFDIPLNAFTAPTGGGGTGSPLTSNLGYITLVSNPASPAAILVDNIYFY